MKDNIFKKFSYDIKKYNFRELIENLFRTKDLENLHTINPTLLPEDDWLVFENESQTDFHKTFYNRLNSNWIEFTELYERFIYNEIYPQFDEDIIFQYAPTFRAQTPNNKAIHKWHIDSDKDHNHPVGEINYCIAITNMIDSSAIWIESSPGKNDHKPMNILLGEYHRFDGNQCSHGNKKNLTNKMRFSLDFRILPKSLYKFDENKNLSLTSGKQFKLGDYYKQL